MSPPCTSVRRFYRLCSFCPNVEWEYLRVCSRLGGFDSHPRLHKILNVYWGTYKPELAQCGGFRDQAYLGCAGPGEEYVAINTAPVAEMVTTSSCPDVRRESSHDTPLVFLRLPRGEFPTKETSPQPSASPPPLQIQLVRSLAHSSASSPPQSPDRPPQIFQKSSCNIHPLPPRQLSCSGRDFFPHLIERQSALVDDHLGRLRLFRLRLNVPNNLITQNLQHAVHRREVPS
jgi:hypothetical protein